ncbi:hypothetical protein DL768_008506 [Monosporascus sp. mg162]|nr:hypothetical protein DL768_008506 [Monosporascus sp. mg162]
MRCLGRAGVARRPLRRHIAIGGAVAILLHTQEHKSQPGPTDIYRVTNDTLGFSKVFVVGLPERSDKRDSMALTSALGHSPQVATSDDSPGSTRALSSSQAAPTTITLWLEPYGWSWDLLWLGHCGEDFPELLDENKGKPTDDAGIRYMSRKFTVSDDPTVPDLDKVTGLVNFRIELPHTRWVHITGAPICTFAYALSNQGARKVLFGLSVDHLQALLTARWPVSADGPCRAVAP